VFTAMSVSIYSRGHANLVRVIRVSSYSGRFACSCIVLFRNIGKKKRGADLGGDYLVSRTLASDREVVASVLASAADTVKLSAYKVAKLSSGVSVPLSSTCADIPSLQPELVNKNGVADMKNGVLDLSAGKNISLSTVLRFKINLRLCFWRFGVSYYFDSLCWLGSICWCGRAGSLAS
jgi:hypothetical protein